MARDRRLALRTGLTLAAVLAVDLLFAVVVASLLSPWLTALRDLLAGAGLAVPQPLWMGSAVLLGLGLVALAHYGYAREQLLAAVDAETAGPETYPDLHGRATRLAATAGLEPPALAVVDADVPNSLAVGSPGDSTVVVSEGLLDRLDGDQLDAVLAHELAHVSNRDAAVMMLASFLPAMAADQYNPFRKARPALLGVGLLVAYAAGVLLLNPATGAASILAAAVMLLVLLLFGGVALGLLGAPVLLLARRLSRDREFVADRAGARLSGEPAALATALSELSEAAAEPPAEDVRTTPDGVSASGASGGSASFVDAGVRSLCLLPHGFDGEADDWAATRSHPPVEERIARLRDLASEATERVREAATW